MAHPELSDRPERERVERDLGTSIVVEAAAGTGKTTLTVARILHAVRTGVLRMEGLAAITFTDKAALELRLRLRHELERAVSAAGGVEGERCAQALAELDRGRVCTIHALARGLLLERPTEAGIDPGFRQADALESARLASRVWQGFLRESLDRREPRLMRALAMGLSLSGMWKSAEKLLDLPELAPVHARPPEAPSSSPAEFVDYWKDVVEQLTLLERSCADPSDRGLAEGRVLRRLLAEAIRLDGGELEAFLVTGVKVRAAPGSQKSWGDARTCKRHKQLRKELEERHEALRAELGRSVATGLLDWLWEWVAAYRRHKQAAGVLDFHDLLLHARNLLRDHPAVRRLFQDRFTMLIVDEFQDTDPLQAELVFFMAEDGPAASDWREVRLKPGKLMLVGDPKQSIYRFRGADIETFETAKQLLATQGELVRIRQNFRTVPALIDWLNGLFSRHLVRPPDGAYQPDYVALEPFEGRGPGGTAPAVAGLPVVVLPGTSAEGRREAEAAALTAQVARLLAGNEFRLAEGDGGSRALQPGDVAILYRAGTGLPVLERALEAAGIPYRADAGRAFYGSEEVSALAETLAAIDDPGDSVALVAALRGPFFGITDVELLAWAAGGQDVESPSLGLAWALGVLDGLRRGCRTISIAALIGRLIEQTGIGLAARLRPVPPRLGENLARVAELARAMERAGPVELGAFARWLRGRIESQARESAPPSAETDRGRLQLMSIHQSKGLEFPAVLLFDLASLDSKRPGSGLLVDRATGRLALEAGSAREPFRTAEYAELRLQEERRESAELVRLLYVAATRARDYLLVPFLPGAPMAGSQAILTEGFVAAWTSREVADGGDVAVALPVPGPDACAVVSDAVPEEAPDSADGFAELERRWSEARRGVLERASRGLPISTPTGKAGEAEREAETERPEGLSEPSPARRTYGRAEAQAFGTAFHRVMEHVELSTGAGLEALARQCAFEEGVPGRSEQVAELARRCLRSPAVIRAAASARPQREVPFCVRVDGELIEGAIDLMFLEEGQLVIVDYKTDRAGAGAEGRVLNARRIQASVYVRAVEAGTGLPVRELVLVFARTGEEWRAWPTEARA